MGPGGLARPHLGPAMPTGVVLPTAGRHLTLLSSHWGGESEVPVQQGSTQSSELGTDVQT